MPLARRQPGSGHAARGARPCVPTQQWSPAAAHLARQSPPTHPGTYYARTPFGVGKSLWGSSGLEPDGKRAQLASLRVFVAASGGAQWTLDPGSITWRSSKGGE